MGELAASDHIIQGEYRISNRPDSVLTTLLGSCVAACIWDPALKIGGMYGVLFEEGNPASFQVAMVGFVRDVVTQLRRGLDGFWIAHPDFVRLAIALVHAWRRRERDPADTALETIVKGLVPDPFEQAPLLDRRTRLQAGLKREQRIRA
jgi:hypothetical protein